MFDPVPGRFLQEDPLDFAAGDPNLHRYVGNSPTNATDPSGMQEYPGKGSQPATGRRILRLVEKEVDVLVSQGPNQPPKLQKVKRWVEEEYFVPYSPDELKMQRMVAAINAKRQAVEEALAAAKEFTKLAKEIKSFAAERLDKVNNHWQTGIPHGVVEAMEKEGLAYADGGYTVVLERLGDKGYYFALLAKETYRWTHRIEANKQGQGFGPRTGPALWAGGADYTPNKHAHKLMPDPKNPPFDLLGGYRYTHIYGTSYRIITHNVTECSKDELDRIMRDPKAFAKAFADGQREIHRLKERNEDLSILAGKFLPELLVSIIPGLNTADKIDKGNGWDIAIAVLEDGSVVLGVGLFAKTAKASAKMKIAASAMLGTAAGVNFGKAAYEFRYGDQQKAMLYLSEAKLRLLGFSVFEINQIKKAGDALRKLEKSALKAANCFPEETLVGTETGLRSIKTVEPCDRVWAFDFATGSWRLCPVECRHDSTFTGPVVTLDVGAGEVTATGGHPFWVIEGDDLDNRPPAGELPPDEDCGEAVPGRWVDSQHLRTGDVIFRRDEGPARIQRIVIQHESIAVCNLTVAGLHTFAVGTDQVLVHNTSDSEKLANKAIEAGDAAGKGDAQAVQKATKEAEAIVHNVTSKPKYKFEAENITYSSKTTHNDDGSVTIEHFATEANGASHSIGISEIKNGTLEHSFNVPESLTNKELSKRMYAEAKAIGYKSVKSTFLPVTGVNKRSDNWTAFMNVYDPVKDNRVEAALATPAGKVNATEGLKPVKIDIKESVITIIWE